MENENFPPASVPTLLHLSQLSPGLSLMTETSMASSKTVKHPNDLSMKGNSSGIEVKTELMANEHVPGDKSLLSMESVTLIDKNTKLELIEKKETFRTIINICSVIKDKVL